MFEKKTTKIEVQGQTIYLTEIPLSAMEYAAALKDGLDGLNLAHLLKAIWKDEKGETPEWVAEQSAEELADNLPALVASEIIGALETSDKGKD